MAVELDQETASLKQEPLGFKLTSVDASDLVSLTPSTIGTSRLAPYLGWESFIAQARHNWDIWIRIVGWREVSRVGVRYINRIDIPTPEERPVTIEDYLRLNFKLPPADLPPVTHFAINAQAPLGKDNCKLILNAGSVPSPLVKTASFVLDIDVSLETELPRNEEALWEIVGRMREHKNFVFETCITDRTRALFL